MKEYAIPQCHELFDALFPNGFSAADIMKELAPNSWEQSPYILAFHPTVEQAYARSVQLHQGLQNLIALKNPDKSVAHESFEQFAETYETGDIQPNIELQELIAACVWDIFSDNNDVVKDGKRYHIGSFRGSAGFIAERLNKTSEKQYDYMDFYMGSFHYTEFCDLTPLYEWLFKRLKNLGCDWIFHFTQIGIVDLRGLKKEETVSPEHYDPQKALTQELHQAEEQKKLDDFKAQLDDLNAKEREDALYKPPPAIVQAYRNVYGTFPKGWVFI